MSALQPKSDPQNSAHALAVCCFQTDQNSSRVSLGSFLRKRGGEKSNTNNKKLTKKSFTPGSPVTLLRLLPQGCWKQAEVPRAPRVSPDNERSQENYSQAASQLLVATNQQFVFVLE